MTPDINSSEEPVPLPTGIHPVVKERVNQLIEQTAAKGISIVITDGFRSTEEQNQIYEKGRSLEGNVVTHAKGGESYHNFGLAVDFAIETPSGQVIWDIYYDGNGNGQSDWMEVAETAKALGFEWGGDWAEFKDYPHLQMDFGLSIFELQRGERPPHNIETENTNF
ncbi:M15 family peptidase [Lysinibacillus yapensis]|uniref:M15 family peptidase n=1 Tax=Ureibacillus yapensis TaxID=2304605 RepID=A0A396SD96_9BACL|nr:M15 family metallopeptidase [Lysinibacillus yapensis]RHW37687.1 M15 family peptidase [Lysinibacillus yapensis]